MKKEELKGRFKKIGNALKMYLKKYIFGPLLPTIKMVHRGVGWVGVWNIPLIFFINIIFLTFPKSECLDNPVSDM